MTRKKTRATRGIGQVAIATVLGLGSGSILIPGSAAALAAGSHASGSHASDLYAASVAAKDAAAKAIHYELFVSGIT